MANGWKICAMIFLTLLVLETAFIVWSYNMAVKDDSKRTECAVNICEEYDAYYYNTMEKTCSCWQGNEIVKTKYMGVEK